VLIYNAGSNYPAAGGNFGGITLGGAGTITLSAPASGPYTGITIFQQRTNSRALSVTNSGSAQISGGIYAPGALVTLSGLVHLQATVIADRMSMTNSASSTLTADGAGASMDASAGELLAGDLAVYVSDPAGSFSPDELA